MLIRLVTFAALLALLALGFATLPEPVQAAPSAITSPTGPNAAPALVDASEG